MKRLICFFCGHRPLLSFTDMSATFPTEIMAATTCARCSKPMVVTRKARLIRRPQLRRIK